MPGVKTNEREGTRAVLRHSRMSASKVRHVLDLIRGQDVDRAAEILFLGDHEAAVTVGKVLASAVANAVHNDKLSAEELLRLGLCCAPTRAAPSNGGVPGPGVGPPGSASGPRTSPSS